MEKKLFSETVLRIFGRKRSLRLGFSHLITERGAKPDTGRRCSDEKR